MHPSHAPTLTTLALLASLYCAQGLPSGLVAHALPVLLRQHGVDLTSIGLVKLLALPWLLKVLWAPWVDRIGSYRLGHHRGWILPMQATVIVGMACLAWLHPSALFGPAWWWMMGILLIINLAAATQDVATDGLAVRLLPDRWRGLGNGIQVGAYKVGMLASGSGLLLVIGAWGWHATLGMLALALVVLTVPIWRFREAECLPAQAVQTDPMGPSLLIRHGKAFLAHAGVSAWLVVVLTYKLGDALGSPMIKPMLVDQGWQTGALGQLTLVSTLAGIGGALLGGWLYPRLGAMHALLAFGTLQSLGLFGLAWLAHAGGSPVWVYGASVFEQVADGMSTVALFAVMMRMCRPQHEGADFTFQASSLIVLTGLAGASSGWLATQLGYQGLFITAGCVAAVMLVPVWRLGHQLSRSS